MRKIPKFPLKMANGADIRTIEELRKNADIRSILNYYLNGRLIKWCKAYNYEDLLKQILELNETILYNLCDVLEIKIDDAELHNFLIENDEIFNGYSEFCSYQSEKNAEDDKFTELCLEHIASKTDISGYHISLFPIEQENDTIKYWELEICDNLTDLYFKCILSNADSNDKFFETVSNIVKNISKISAYTVETICSGSGGYGYGLELI